MLPRDDLYPWNLGSSWATPPDSSESWHVLPCSASTIRASEKSSIMANRKFYTGFPTSHQPSFYAAPNFLKMGINYLNLSSFAQFRQYRTKSLLQFHYMKTFSGKVVAPSIAFRVVSISWQGDAPFPWNLPPSDLPSPVNGILWEMSELIT